MMKKFLLAALLALLILPCAVQAEGVRIVVASDPHYLSPALVEDRDALLRVVSAADGKVTQYTPEIVQAFVDEMLALSPDAIVLSGDLTLNGGKESHQELIGLLTPLREAGIPVLAIPGNHDGAGKAYRFTATGSQPVVGMNAVGFKEAYADFGYADARSRDEASFSYMYELSPDLWLLALDVNTPEAPGSLREETLRWAEEQLQEASRAGARVIGVSHQNLMQHYTGFAFGYQIFNAALLEDLYAQYGVRLHLSGHMHLQHIGQDDNVTEIATSSLAVYPHHYGVIEISGGQAVYAAHPLDVEAWAQKTGAEDENLLHFDQYSRDFFDRCNSGRRIEQVYALDISEEDKAAMLEYSRELNRNVFAGVSPQGMDPRIEALWQEYFPSSFFTNYLQWMLESVTSDMRQITVALQ